MRHPRVRAGNPKEEEGQMIIIVTLLLFFAHKAGQRRFCLVH